MPLESAWSPQDVPIRAREAGLGELDDRHWKVITSCREEAARTGRAPRLRRLAVLTGFDAAELRRLFRGDVETLVARISGVARWPEASRPRRGTGPQRKVGS